MKVYQQKHQLYIRMCLQMKLATELDEDKKSLFNVLKRTLGNSNLNNPDDTLQSQY